MNYRMLACILSLAIATASATPPDPVESQFLVTRLALFKVTASELFADSEGFRAIRNPGQFLIKVSLYEDATRKVLIGTQEQKIGFDIPRKYLKQLRLKAL